MPFTAQQIAIGANYTLETYRLIDPIDQINYAHEFLKWLLANKALDLLDTADRLSTPKFSSLAAHA